MGGSDGEFSRRIFQQILHEPIFFRVFKSLRPHPNQSVPLITVSSYQTPPSPLAQRPCLRKQPSTDAHVVRVHLGRHERVVQDDGTGDECRDIDIHGVTG